MNRLNHALILEDTYLRYGFLVSNKPRIFPLVQTVFVRLHLALLIFFPTFMTMPEHNIPVCQGQGFAVGCGFGFAVDLAKIVNDTRPRNKLTKS